MRDVGATRAGGEVIQSDGGSDVSSYQLGHVPHRFLFDLYFMASQVVPARVSLPDFFEGCVTKIAPDKALKIIA